MKRNIYNFANFASWYQSSSELGTKQDCFIVNFFKEGQKKVVIVFHCCEVLVESDFQ